MRPADGTLSAEGLLAAARTGDEQAVGHLCDQHGEDLYSLACATLGAGQDAEDVVVQVLVDVCVRPTLLRPGYDLHHELARLVDLRCTRPHRG